MPPRKSKELKAIEAQMGYVPEPMSRALAKPPARYVDVVDTTAEQGGGSVFVIKPAGLHYVAMLAREGNTLASIARRLGMTLDTLAKCRRRQPEVQEALDAGRGELGDELTSHLLRSARAGEYVPAIFLMKALLGYRDVGDAQGAGVTNNTQVNVTFVLPPATDPADVMKLLPAEDAA